MSGDVKQILLVEPESVLAEITSFRLELLGYAVTTVSSAEDALKQIAKSDPDLVITDLELPGLKGVGLIERLSSDEETIDLPVMVLSTDADLDRVQAVFKVGASDFLVVPFHMESLEEKVAAQLAAPREKKPAAEAVAANET